MESTMEYAVFWRRFVAYIVDVIILGIVSGILLAIFGQYSTMSYSTNVIGIVYIIGFWTWRGQTPGKMALGVKIVQTDGSPIGFERSILRYIGYFVSAIILCIGFFMIAWDSKKQGLHDKIAGTYVVKTQ